jgi:cyclophilin family peptidyl-prolyl cis-trans isomerase
MTLLVAAVMAVGLAEPQVPTVSGVQGPRATLIIEDRGEMVIEFYDRETPQTAAHVIGLIRKNFYDGIRFHRVENYPRPFLIAAGDPLTRSLPLDDAKIGTGGSGKTIPFEKSARRFVNGTVGLVLQTVERNGARAIDLNSGDSQFFICNGVQQFLDGKYVPFGQVVQGIDLIPKVQLGDRILSLRMQGG